MALQDPGLLSNKQIKSNAECASDLGEQISKLSVQINTDTYHLLQLIAEFDECEGWASDGARCCADWLNLKCGLANSAAREKVRVARRLNKLPAINKAFEKGEISYSKARAVTRVATAKNEDELLEIAKKESASHIEKIVRKYKQVEYSMAKSLEELYQSRELKYYQDEHGMWVITARLPQDEGGLVVKAIDEIVRLQDRTLNSDTDNSTDVNTNGDVSAETLESKAEECEKDSKGCETFADASQNHENCSEDVSAETPKLAAEEPKVEPETEDCYRWAQKKADALCVMAESFVTGGAGCSGDGNGLKGLAGHERCQVVLHMDVETLKQQNEENGVCSCSSRGHDEHKTHQQVTPHHIDGVWITPENAKRLSCDASLLTVLQDKDGNVLNIGRKTRTVPPHISRALDIRDETCRFPGCTCSDYVDFHHIQHWANGGETSKGNLIKLCRTHHRLLHSGLFTIEAIGDKHNPEFVFKMKDEREVLVS